jgi:hypothetical protein
VRVGLVVFRRRSRLSHTHGAEYGHQGPTRPPQRPGHGVDRAAVGGGDRRAEPTDDPEWRTAEDDTKPSSERDITRTMDEGQVDDAVGACGPGAESLRLVKGSCMGFRAKFCQLLGGVIRTRQADDLMAGANQLFDNRLTYKTGCAGDEYSHVDLPMAWGNGIDNGRDDLQLKLHI